MTEEALLAQCGEGTLKQNFKKNCLHEYYRNFLNCSMNKLRGFIEWQAFGVCSAIGRRLGIATSRIRTWFIYISFLTIGSPVIIYMIMAFWLNIKKYILSAKRNPLKYL